MPQAASLAEQFVRLDMAHAYGRLSLATTTLPLAAGQEKYPFSGRKLAADYAGLEPAIAKVLQRYILFYHLRLGRLFHPVLILLVLQDKAGWLPYFAPLTRLLRKHASWLSTQREEWKWWQELISFDDSKGAYNAVFFKAKRLIRRHEAMAWLRDNWAGLDTAARQSAFDIVSLNPENEEAEFFTVAEKEFKGKRKLKAGFTARFLAGTFPDFEEIRQKIEAEVNPAEWINFFLSNTLRLTDPDPATELIPYLFSGGSVYDLQETAEFLDMQQFNGQIILHGKPLEAAKEKSLQRFLVNIFRHASFFAKGDLGEDLLKILKKEAALMSDQNLLNLAAGLPMSLVDDVALLANAQDVFAAGRYRSSLTQKIKKVTAFRRINE